MWLATLDKLKTRTRLHRLEITIDCVCPICGAHPETGDHLYFGCKYSVDCGTAVMKWIGFSHCKTGSNALFRWLQRTAPSAFRRGVTYPSVATIVYHVWKSINYGIRQMQVPTIQKTVKDIQGVLDI
ncbi:uncharacterized protein [Spinacia oleracea]|uniref:Reverse transcriptase zinc-binding domain-containing protein n=1 Tax=Spinacia oleracea TaxID=3562 RepID=A0ABM3R8X9_SPIOL|nr:uncharacterized protein LOC130467555 [Spinacia oleracea]